MTTTSTPLNLAQQLIRDLHSHLAAGDTLAAEVVGKGTFRLHHGLSHRQRELLEVGGVINHLRSRQSKVPAQR